MNQDLSLRKAEDIVRVSYASLFYWRHKIMTILNEETDGRFHGTLELINMKMKYLDKYRNIKKDEEDEEEFQKEGEARSIYFAFLYQRDNRLNSYIYNRGARSFIYDLSDYINEKSMVCLSSNYPFRYHLLYKKVKVADKNNYKRMDYYNTDSVRKYLGQFTYWIKMFRGVSSKNLVKYAAFFRNHIIFKNMEGIILSSLRECGNMKNQYAARGELGF